MGNAKKFWIFVNFSIAELIPNTKIICALYIGQNELNVELLLHRIDLEEIALGDSKAIRHASI